MISNVASAGGSTRHGTSEHTTCPLPLLFNLELNPGESYDLTAKHPDVASQLAEQMTRWETELAADPKGWK